MSGMRRVPWSAFFKCAFAMLAAEGVAILANFLSGTMQMVVCYVALAVMIVSGIGMITINAMVVFLDFRKLLNTDIEGDPDHPHQPQTEEPGNE